ncbi:MAG: hypothetical protein HKN57_07105 [Xanthomonadales bacterium]|nr:hypothetical protein [Gammaproteobacteria bacterium]MBT8053390.1 hypothetical protein [Gammaproteobacteria bacterium]NND57002.1 hypothetical protein [Xanthomonadales bacterium]NNK50811.1 hypothetical protein [Xanthomonadales bacterium]
MIEVLQIVCGFGIGYLIATFSESFLHAIVGHASDRARAIWHRYPRLFHFMIQSYYRHNFIHHEATFKENFHEMFTCDAHQAELDASIPNWHRDRIKNEMYGLTISLKCYLSFNVILIPTLLLIYFYLGPWMAVGFLPWLALKPLWTLTIHKLLHHELEKAREMAPWGVKWLVGTSYYRWMMRNHFMHHNEQSTNFNLIPGGDYLWFKARKATDIEKAEMAKLGMYKASISPRFGGQSA